MNAASIRRPRGQDLVEFAFTILLLSLISFAIFDLGRVVYYYSALQNAVREGARWGIVHPDDVGGVVMTVQNRALGLDPAALTPVDVDYDDGEKTLTVTFEYIFTPVTPMIGRFFTDGLGVFDPPTIKASSTMHYEY